MIMETNEELKFHIKKLEESILAKDDVLLKLQTERLKFKQSASEFALWREKMAIYCGADEYNYYEDGTNNIQPDSDYRTVSSYELFEIFLETKRICANCGEHESIHSAKDRICPGGKGHFKIGKSQLSACPECGGETMEIREFQVCKTFGCKWQKQIGL